MTFADMVHGIERRHGFVITHHSLNHIQRQGIHAYTFRWCAAPILVVDIAHFDSPLVVRQHTKKEIHGRIARPLKCHPHVHFHPGGEVILGTGLVEAAATHKHALVPHDVPPSGGWMFAGIALLAHGASDHALAEVAPAANGLVGLDRELLHSIVTKTIASPLVVLHHPQLLQDVHHLLRFTDLAEITLIFSSVSHGVDGSVRDVVAQTLNALVYGTGGICRVIVNRAHIDGGIVMGDHAG
mmetsp:Transcript_30457/g.66945  ORF Transcript_30457/g.66945 Transcript_30457/m.66945 type:complete len:241 (+) Transcript_30457:2044-2766(+)